MANAGSNVIIRLALDPFHWRSEDKAGWAMSLAGAVEAAAPPSLRIEAYEIGDTLVHIRLRSHEEPKRLRKLLQDDEGMRRLRSRLADLGARPEIEIE